MMYLAEQIVWFLIAAFAAGMTIGWITHAPGEQGEHKQ